MKNLNYRSLSSVLFIFILFTSIEINFATGHEIFAGLFIAAQVVFAVVGKKYGKRGSALHALDVSALAFTLLNLTIAVVFNIKPKNFEFLSVTERKDFVAAVARGQIPEPYELLRTTSKYAVYGTKGEGFLRRFYFREPEEDSFLEYHNIVPKDFCEYHRRTVGGDEKCSERFADFFLWQYPHHDLVVLSPPPNRNSHDLELVMSFGFSPITDAIRPPRDLLSQVHSYGLLEGFAEYFANHAKTYARFIYQTFRGPQIRTDLANDPYFDAARGDFERARERAANLPAPRRELIESKVKEAEELWKTYVSMGPTYLLSRKLEPCERDFPLSEHSQFGMVSTYSVQIWTEAFADDKACAELVTVRRGNEQT